jgi:glutaredoxin
MRALAAVYHRRMKAPLVVAALFFACAAFAQQYRWVDDQGRVHYTDTPPPPSAKGIEKKNLKGNAVGEQQNTQLAKALKAAPVTLYSHPDCKAPCDTAREILGKRGIPFREVSVVDQARYEELKKLTGEGQVPVLVIGKRVESSPSESAYNQALDEAGYPRAAR